MSDAKPYTIEECRDGEPRAQLVLCSRLAATVRALNAAQAEVTALRVELEKQRRESDDCLEEKP